MTSINYGFTVSFQWYGAVRRGKPSTGSVRLGWARHGKAGPGREWWGRVQDRHGVVGFGKAMFSHLLKKGCAMAKAAALKVVAQDRTNGAASQIAAGEPYTVTVTITGSADFLFHRWNCEAVEEKKSAAKNSAAKKTDNLESYVYRDDAGELCIPGEYLRQSIIHAAKFKQDPRSPRKSAMDLYKAGVVSLKALASVGKKDWDYEDRRRVVIQRSGVNRVRPALRAGWSAKFELMVMTPEYIDRASLNDTLATAGRLIGVGDFRPTYGRFQVVEFK